MYVHVEPSMSSFMVRPVRVWIQPRAAEAAAGAALSRSDPATLNTMTARNSPKAARKARRVPGGAAEAWGTEGPGRGGDVYLGSDARIRWTVGSGQKTVDSDLGPSDLGPSDLRPSTDNDRRPPARVLPPPGVRRPSPRRRPVRRRRHVPVQPAGVAEPHAHPHAGGGGLAVAHRPPPPRRDRRPPPHAPPRRRDVVGAHARPRPPLQLRHGAVLRALPRGRGKNPRPRVALPRRPGDGDGPVDGPAAPRGGGGRLRLRPPRRARHPPGRV